MTQSYYRACDAQFWEQVPGIQGDQNFKSLDAVVSASCDEFGLKKTAKEIKILSRLLALESASDVDNDKVQISETSFKTLTKLFGSTEKRNGSCHLLKQIQNIMINSRAMVDREKISWFAGPKNRETADEILSDKKPGTYLIRMDEGEFVFTLRASKGSVHYIILGDPSTASNQDKYDAKLKFKDDADEQTYPDIVQFVNRKIRMKEFDDVKAEFVCRDLKFNALFKGYAGDRNSSG
uniref:SH2 domain-containing protein n=1 Tax=Ciona savignyi TaxID=51511 RepID=H2ZGT5_CIOSA